MIDRSLYEPGLIIHSSKPYNAEPRLGRLRASMRTEQSDFYVRSHGDIPELHESVHRVTVDGLVSKALDFSVGQMRERFSEKTVTAVMQCAGNRRVDMQPVKPTLGDPWAPGAIGNATWIGVGLADVLHAAGAKTDGGLHVAFVGCDEVVLPKEGRFTYGVSIPISKAMSEEVLLAYAMNGSPLAPEHGFPLRAVVPGYAGVRSAKWLTAIIVQDRPSDNHMQARDYKLVPATATEDTVDWEQGITINEMPLNSAICEPSSHAELKVGLHTIRGYAVATVRGITRVDVSINGGVSWIQATLEHDPASRWSWTFWSATVDLGRGKHELVVRAWDSAGQTQLAVPDDIWNFKGYLCASWHRVSISAD